MYLFLTHVIIHHNLSLLNFTEEQILQLAPDDASKKAGIGLSGLSKWVSKGACGTVVWGECQGSGSKPYQTGIDLANTVFKCSCPSRKFPCKHGLGLFLLYAKQPAIFTNQEVPVWISEWLAKKEQRQEKKSTKEEKKPDEAAQAKRQESRENKVAAGVEEALLWIKDIVRNGIINIPEKPESFWEGMAKRMIDAQAPGVAGTIKELGKINFYKEGWQSEFTGGLISAYLLISAWKNRDLITPTLLQDIKSRIGFTQNTEALKEQEGTVDTWLVLSKQTTEEDGIVTERHWLHGLSTGKAALILQFIVRGQGSQWQLTPGMYLEAEMVYYPSAIPLRAIIKKQAAGKPAMAQQPLTGLQLLFEKEMRMHTQLPFSVAYPYIVQQLTPVLYQQQWWLQDKDNHLIQINPSFKNTWKLLAISGGRPLDTAVLAKENTFEPLGVWEDKIYKYL